jgi:hypothetical protein
MVFLSNRAAAYLVTRFDGDTAISGRSRRNDATFEVERIGGRYWDRTSDFHRVKMALYR